MYVVTVDAQTAAGGPEMDKLQRVEPSRSMRKARTTRQVPDIPCH